MKRINIYAVKQVKEKSAPYNLNHSQIHSPEDAVKIITEVFNPEEDTVEKFIIITLDAKHAVAVLHVISVGILTSTAIHPREVFMAAILNNAKSIILVHNHPSGDPTPSPEDKKATGRLKAAGELMGIDVIDHLVIGDNGRFVSFRQKGLL